MIKSIDSHCHFNQFPDWKSEVEDFEKLQEEFSAAFIPIIAAHQGNKDYKKQFRKIIIQIKSNSHLFLGIGFWIDTNNLSGSFNTARSIPQPLFKFLKIQSSKDKLSLKNKTYFKIVDFASSLKLPLYIHCTKAKEFVNLDAVEELVAYRPRVTIILGHMGGVYKANNERALKIMIEHPNTFLDTSASFHKGSIERSVKTIGSDRLLFGTDFPVLDFTEQYSAVVNAKITRKDKENILFNNAARLFRLKPL